MNVLQAKEEALKLLPDVCALNPSGVDIQGIKSEALARFSTTYGLSIPKELKGWLFVCNGALVDPGGLYGIGHHRRLEKTARPVSLAIEDFYDWHPSWLERKWIGIAGDGCGDYYALATAETIKPQNTHPVYFVDQADLEEPDYAVASSIWHFLRFLFEAELSRQSGGKVDWPFNREFVLQIDPALGLVQGASLPWVL